MAVANYEEANGHFPPAYIPGPDGTPWHSWRVLLLPYIEHQDLYEQYSFEEPWNGPNNIQLLARMPRLYEFHNARDRGQTFTNYLAVVGPETAWPGVEGLQRANLLDDPGDTILIVENRGLEIPWTEPRDLNFAILPMEVDHPHGISSWYKEPAIAMIDGSLYRLRATTQPETLRALLTTRGQEPLTYGKGWELLPDGRQREEKE